mgnify:CR=1 FL=1
MRTCVLCSVAVVVAVSVMAGPVQAGQNSQVAELRKSLEQDGEEAVARVKEAEPEVQKQLVPQLLDTYLQGGWDEAEAARSLLMDMGREYSKRIAPTVGKRFRQADRDDIATRLPLMELLRDFGPGARFALPAVVEGLKGDDLNIQQQAVWAASAIGEEAQDAVPPLLDLLDAEDALLREDVAEALKIIGVPASAVPRLSEALESEDPAVREFAVGALKSLGPDAAEAVPQLINLVKNADRFMKLKAIEALGAIGPEAEEAVPVLLNLARGKSQRMQEIIQSALDNVKTDNVAPVARDGEASCDEGGSATIELQAEARDDTPVALKTTVLEGPEHGSLEQTGPVTFRYSCPRGFAGQESFTWKVSDGKAESSAATVTLNIEPDRTAPKVTSVAATGDKTTMVVSFSEPVDKDSASNAENYSISHDVEVKKAQLRQGGATVELTTSELSPDTEYKLQVQNVRDRAAAGNVTESESSTFRYYAWKRAGLSLLARADGNAKDDGNENHGSLNDGVSYSSDAVAGQAFMFAGAGGESKNTVSFGDVGAMNGPGTFTVAFWFKRTNDRSGDTNHTVSNVMFSKGSNSNNDNIEIGTQGSQVEIYLDSQDKDGPESVDAGIENDTWHHLVLTYEKGRDQVAQLYVDGKKVKGWSSWSGNLDGAGGSPLTVGNTHHQETPFEGLIDEVFVFSRVISGEEINALSARR